MESSRGIQVEGNPASKAEVDISAEELAERHEIQERELRASNSLLASVLESPDKIIIFSLDREYRYTAFNANHQRTMKQIWGVDIEIGIVDAGVEIVQ